MSKRVPAFRLTFTGLEELDLKQYKTSVELKTGIVESKENDDSVSISCESTTIKENENPTRVSIKNPPQEKVKCSNLKLSEKVHLPYFDKKQ